MCQIISKYSFTDFWRKSWLYCRRFTWNTNRHILLCYRSLYDSIYVTLPPRLRLQYVTECVLKAQIHMLGVRSTNLGCVLFRSCTYHVRGEPIYSIYTAVFCSRVYSAVQYRGFIFIVGIQGSKNSNNFYGRKLRSQFPSTYFVSCEQYIC